MSKKTEPTVTFDETATESILQSFDFSVDENGIVYDENNVAFRDELGLIHEPDVGGIIPDGNGNPTILRDDFSMIIDYVKER